MRLGDNVSFYHSNNSFIHITAQINKTSQFLKEMKNKAR